jgi:PBSX family phage terminase large subunit
VQSNQIYSPKQAEVILSADARWNLLTGAVSSGKTHVSYDLLIKRVAKQPSGNSLLVGKTERTLLRNVIHPMQERFGLDNVSDIHGDGTMELFGRRFYVVGANDERSLTKIQGLSLVYGYGDEFATWPESFFQMLKSRLRIPGAIFDGTCNPEGPYHWAKKDMIDRAAVLNLKHWQFKIDDNPFLDPDYVRDIKNEYTGLWYKRMILGEWCIAEGAIYDMFDEKKHVVTDQARQAAILKDIHTIWTATDYGTGTVLCHGLFGMDRKGVIYLLSTFWWDAKERGRQKTDTEYTEDLKRLMETCRATFAAAHVKMPPTACHIIPDDALSFIAQCRKTQGLSTIRVFQREPGTVLQGIRLQANLLNQGKYFLFAGNGNEPVIQEYGSYVWDPKAQIKGEDAPLKQHDHGKDCERYSLAVMARGVGGTVAKPKGF